MNNIKKSSSYLYTDEQEMIIVVKNKIKEKYLIGTLYSI